MDTSSSDPIAELNLALEGGAALRTRRPVFPSLWKSYRPATTQDSQKARREEAMARYKEAQYQMMIKSRKMMDAFRKADSATSSVSNEVQPASSSSMDIQEYEKTAPTAEEVVNRAFSHSLMMPEFFHDIPADFEENWLCTPFPEGIRCLLIAKGGKTEARDVEGTKMDEFQSLLPGGSRFQNSEKAIHTVLDCVQIDAKEFGRPNSRRQSVYFVLDVLSWNGKFYYNSSADARFWMKDSWTGDIEGLSTVVKVNSANRNDRLILSLPVFDVSPTGLKRAITSPISFEIDIPNSDSAKTDDEGNDISSSDHELLPVNAWTTPTSIEVTVGGVMFYYKDMDYVGEQTPVMCVLPMADAQRLAAEREAMQDDHPSF